MQINSETNSHLVAIVQEAANLAQDQLTGFAWQSDFYDEFGVAFGDNYNQSIAESIRQQLAAGDFSQLPEIKVISSDILGDTNGAYADSINTIFLSDQFVLTHNIQQIAEVVTEEIGHHIDEQVNTVDSSGDEGYIFARLVFGNGLSGTELVSLKNEDDSGVITVDGVQVRIEKNDSLGTAEWLGNLGYTRLTRSGWVGGNVPNDFYRFTLNNFSNVDFYLTGLGADVDLYLLNSSGQTVLSKSTNSGTSNENINVNLAAGQYYLQVNRWSGDSRNSYYNLSMVTDGAGDNLGWFRDVGTLNSPRSYSDWVGVRDANDYYRFSLSGQSNFSLSLTGLSADANVILLNSSGGEIRRSANSGSSSESINTQLGAGTYYIQVNSLNGNNNTHYNLSLNASLVPTGYYRELSLLSNNDWDTQSGDNNQFEQNPLGGGGDQRWKTDDRIEQIYTDLSQTIFGSRVPMSAGYLHDTSYYYGGYGPTGNNVYHSGIDLDSANWVDVKAVIGGTTTLVQNQSGNYFIGIKADDGNLWIYGHLGDYRVPLNSRINAGDVIGRVGSMMGHLHLEVQNGYTYKQTWSNGWDKTFLANSTISPLQAYWQWRNR